MMSYTHLDFDQSYQRCSNTMATYWVPDLLKITSKGFLATFGIPFWYLLMVPHMHDPAGILICYPELAASLNAFRGKSPTY